MVKKAGKLGLAVVLAVMLAVLPLLAVVWFTLTDSELGMASIIGAHESGLYDRDYTYIPQTVIDKAVELAAELVGESQQKLQNIVDQLLSMYIKAQNQDVVVVFNPGGWGWNMTQATNGWGSILDGIKSQLEDEGHKTLILNYRRTSDGISGIFREFVEAATNYPNKVKDLVTRIRFLTESFPDLRVIIAGESTGTVISDIAMGKLKDDSRVYSIQTGTPFWHKPSPIDRTLLMNDNGTTKDTFSYGDIPAMVWATVRSWFGLSSPDDKPGDILFWLKAPGHDYSWQYPGVYDEIVSFINNHFSRGY